MRCCASIDHAGSSVASHRATKRSNSRGMSTVKGTVSVGPAAVAAAHASSTARHSAWIGR
jgi:hypothetical protein